MLRRISVLASLAVLASMLAVSGSRAAGVDTTLYFHGHTPSGSADSANEFAGGDGPYMDAAPPSLPVPKVATDTGGGNRNFRKNFLNAYWGGRVTGIVTGNPTATFWLQAPAGTKVDVQLFGDGGIGSAAPAATTTLTLFADAVAPTKLEATFDGLSAAITSEMVLQIAVWTADEQSPGKILYDSTEFPSSFRFRLDPLGEVAPKLSFPGGLVHDGSGFIVANGGTGHLLTTSNTGAIQDVIAAGLVVGGVANRGPSGIARDADGTIFAAVADTGEIVYVDGNETGVFARGLGTPQAIEFGADGTLYVADQAGRRLLGVDASGSVSQIATLDAAPRALSVGPDGTIAVADVASSNKVVFVDPTDGSKETVTLPLLNGPPRVADLAFGASGALYMYLRDVKAIFRLSASREDFEHVVVDLVDEPVRMRFWAGGLAVVAHSAAAQSIATYDVGELGVAVALPSIDPADKGPTTAWVHRNGGVAIDPATYAGPLPSTELRLVGNNAFEPTMGRQSDGDLFFVGGDFDQAGGLLGSPKVLRSSTRGHTWQDVQPRDLAGLGTDAPTITLDPYVWVDPTTDRVFTFDLTAACQYLSYSDTDGESWKTVPLACGLPPVDHQTLVGGKPRAHTTKNYPNVLYHCSNWVAVSPCGRSLDGGETWEAGGVSYVGLADPNRFAEADPSDVEGSLFNMAAGVLCGGLHGHAITDPEGRLFVPKGHCGRPYVSVSEDDGTTFTSYPVSTETGNVGTQTTVASDTEGNLYYVWLNSARRPMLATSTDHGKTWSEPVDVSHPSLVAGNLPSIDAGTPGNVVIYYLGSTNGNAWNGFVTTATDALSADPLLTTTTVSPLTDPLVRGACGPGRCQNVFDFLDAIIDDDGRAWVTVVDTCVASCATNPATASTASAGAVAPLLTGPNLRGGGALPPLD